MRVKLIILMTMGVLLSACGTVATTTSQSNFGQISNHSKRAGHVDKSKLVVRPSVEAQQEIQKAIANTNKLRAEKGLKPFVQDNSLMAYAQLRATELTQHFSHTRPDGRSAFSGLEKGFRGENIAAGNGGADKTVLEQWRNSKGHYGNIVNENYVKIGIGRAYAPNDRYGYYWVQVFGSGETTSPYQFE